jgi:squalene synthase HpnC
MSAASSVDHYENFPVASWLCPPRLRPPIAAIYHFARCADDMADEGPASADQRLNDLQAYRADLQAVLAGRSPSPRWAAVFSPLAVAISQWQLPGELLEALLDAFEQDVRYTAAGQRYRSDDELLDYCSRSANPVGRLLLHLYGQTDALSLAQSDQICSALQLINFWQDLSVDLARGRIYPSLQTMARLDLTLADLQADSDSPQARALVQAYVRDARERMHQGAPLALRLPGRIGWELRAVVQGGMRMLERIEALGYASWRQRPRLGKFDALLILWRCLWMR